MPIMRAAPAARWPDRGQSQSGRPDERQRYPAQPGRRRQRTLSTTGGSTGGAGSCSVTATMAGNGNYDPLTSAALTISVTAAPLPFPRLINLSTRDEVGVGDNVLIGGFAIGGTAPKKVLIRALGPTLSDAGVTGVLANPSIRLTRVDGTPVAENDDWQANGNTSEITALGRAADHPAAGTVYADCLGRRWRDGSGTGGALRDSGIRHLADNQHPVLASVLRGPAFECRPSHSFQTLLTRPINPRLPRGASLSKPALRRAQGNGNRGPG